MSGGSYNYFYAKLENFANNIDIGESAQRRAFRDLMLLAAEAAHDIEWNDSGDGADEIKSLNAVLSFGKKDAKLIAKAAAFDAIHDVIKNL